MMSVSEYATDINRTVAYVLKKCQELGIGVNTPDDMLEEEDIIILDNNLDDDIEEAEEIETFVKNSGNTDGITKQKLKKKSDNSSFNKSKKDFASKKKEMYKNKEKLISNTVVNNDTCVIYQDNMTVASFASALGVKSADLVKKLFSLGVMSSVNMSISYDDACILALDYGKELKREETTNVADFENFSVVDSDNDLVSRPPVVTIMGHVDHGKTTLLDTIRKSSVASLEAGGITQAISAYQVKCNDKLITFIDTPGHAAFTEMRARGASITDIIIIIVAADDGVMPQTKEVIDHAKAANVPILVAINKIDKPNVNPERVMTELTEYGLTPEEWGGDTIMTRISALNGTGVSDLLENILLVAEMQNYRANPNRYALGTVIESRLDKHLGPVVTVLIQNGTLRLGDPIVVGSAYGKIRSLKNDKGEEITSALPGTPVYITGINDTPIAGDKFMAFETEKQARSIGEERKNNAKLKENSSKTMVSLDDLFSKIQDGIKEINVIVKADVNGSAEAVKNTLEKIDVDGVHVNVIRSSVGAITESDVVLAKATNAIVIGFNIRPGNDIKDYASSQGVEIRLYDIIYKAVEDMEAAMKGMLDPIYEEKVIGSATVKQLFKFSKVGTIAGVMVNDGVIKRDSKVRLIRDSVVIYDGEVGSIQREKDSVKEVKKGLECGITIANFNDIKVTDIIEAYEIVEVDR